MLRSDLCDFSHAYIFVSHAYIFVTKKTFTANDFKAPNNTEDIIYGNKEKQRYIDKSICLLATRFTYYLVRIIKPFCYI